MLHARRPMPDAKEGNDQESRITGKTLGKTLPAVSALFSLRSIRRIEHPAPCSLSAL